MAILAGLVKRQSDNLPKLDAISMFSFLGRNPDFFAVEIRGTKAENNKTDSNADEEYKLPEPIPKEKEIADTLDSKMGIIDEVIKLPESTPKGTEITDQMDKKTDNKTASNADEKYKLPEPIPKEKEIADKMRIVDQLKKYLKPKGTETKDQMDKKTDKKTDSNADEKYKLPEPIPKGTEIADQLEMKTWIIGEVINSGGFGTLYCAADKESPYNFKYAVKIEYMRHDGPFSEIKCYRRIGDPEDMLEWTMSKQLRPLPSRDYRVSDRMANRKHYLGLSPFCGAGCLTYNGSVYRFLVIKRFGKDLQTLLEENNGTFPLKTVCLIGLSVIDALEYVHTCGYVHNDIKASNLLLGHKKKIENQVYLVDFSLACKYIYNSGGHVYGIFGAHGTGTPIFMSRDAHVAGFVPKGDLEVLAYNLIYWLTGHLLWQDFYEINLLLELHKEKWMEDIDNFLRIQFQGENVPNEISTLLHYIKDVNYEEKPDYDFCRKQLKELLKSAGYSDTDYTLEFKETGKLKKDYLQGVGNTLDLVVIGGYFRRRKRTGNYCGFLLACYDSDNQKYQSICELVTGFKDDDLEAHTKFLKQHVTEEPKKYYSCDTIVAEWFEPVQVWEITCADLYLSPLHTAAKGIVDPKKGISLRYPRFVKIREDKSIEDVTSSSQIADMYRNQQQIQNT